MDDHNVYLVVDDLFRLENVRRDPGVCTVARSAELHTDPQAVAACRFQPTGGILAMGTKSRQVPMKRPGQPAELATTYVMLAEPMSSYVSGTTVGRDRRQTFHLNDGRPPASDQPEGWYFVVRGKLWQLAIEVSVLRCDPH